MKTRLRSAFGWRPIGIAAVALVTSVCRDGAPSSPTNTRSNVSRIDVGVLGDQPARVSPPQKIQLWALAVDNAGSTLDVTNAAAWSSSNPAVATVSAGGVVSGLADGVVRVTAEYQGATGYLETQVAASPCAASSLTPPRLVFSAFGVFGCSDDNSVYGERVNVNAAETCRWN